MSRSARAALAHRSTEIQQAYLGLWTAFCDAAADQALRADAVDSRGAAIWEKDGVTNAFAEFFLKGWPFKAASSRRAVDIAVRVTEVFSSDLEKVTKATTQVAYLVSDTGDTLGCGGHHVPFADLDATELACIASRLALESLRGDVRPALVSRKGDGRAFLAEGYRTTPRYDLAQHEIDQQREGFVRANCRVCAP